MSYAEYSLTKDSGQHKSLILANVGYGVVAQKAKYADGGMDQEKVRVGMRIRDARDRAGLTQLELANLLDLTGGAIGQWELGITIPRAQTITKLTRILGVSYEWLMDRDSKKVDGAQNDPEDHALRLLRKLEPAEREMIIRQLEGLTRSKR